MQIDLVEVRNFRNLAPATVRLGPGVIRFVGRNGQGKSNFLEAVHLLAQ
ncbi:MAG: AAA family ATPase, partial [Fibrobacterales bacterium]|nr:AAA family ATPase [Fibrobacterales bacterium]